MHYAGELGCPLRVRRGDRGFGSAPAIRRARYCVPFAMSREDGPKLPGFWTLGSTEPDLVDLARPALAVPGGAPPVISQGRDPGASVWPPTPAPRGGARLHNCTVV